MWLAMWTTRTSATSSHTEKRKRNKSPSLKISTSNQTQTPLPHPSSTHSVVSNATPWPPCTLLRPSPLFPLASSLWKDLSTLSRHSVRGLKAVGVFVCEYQQGGLGIIFNKNNLVALKHSLHLCPCLLFLLLLLHHSFCPPVLRPAVHASHLHTVQCVCICSPVYTAVSRECLLGAVVQA